MELILPSLSLILWVIPFGDVSKFRCALFFCSIIGLVLGIIEYIITETKKKY